MEILASWNKATRIPWGRFLFHRTIRRFVPYTGTVRPRILSLERGQARVAMNDRRRIHNHLNSIHAIALANLGEFATGLALLTALPAGRRAILVELRVQYLHKARGRIIAEAAWQPDGEPDGEPVVQGRLHDEDGHHVATVEATWKVGASNESR